MSAVPRPTAADFLARQRSAGLFTAVVSQRAGAYLAVLGHRTGLSPTALTLINLVLGGGTSVAVGLLAGPMHAGRVPAVLVGLVALLLWQVAYALDCADGQLARVTHRTSPAGARVDVLSDVAAQILLLGSLAVLANAYHRVPVALAAGFAGTWMVNMVTSVLAQGSSAQSLMTSESLVVRLIKLIRDYGALITVIALVIAFVPAWTIWLLAVLTAVNGLFLVASIAAAARAALRPRTEPGPPDATGRAGDGEAIDEIAGPSSLTTAPGRRPAGRG
jgi:phosphatidylglycerophosphate synthase